MNSKDYFIAVFGKLADVVGVLIADPVHLFQYFALNAFGLRVTCGPLGRLVVFCSHHIVERRYLHVAIQWHHFTMLENFIDLTQVDALFGI